ncbi:MAG: riboflavin synthase [Planctomycetes bacterium]|nr:riboflavin synthase [Planctomycetota bacterium]
MFTGLIEHVGTVLGLAPQPGGEARVELEIGPLAEGTKLGDSIAVNGCCLTVVTLAGSHASFDAVPETLRRTALGELKAGSRVNLERALLPGQRLGGHFVQGHIDGTARVVKSVTGGRWAEWHFALEQPELAPQIVEKGSIALDGISLTVAGADGKGAFWVALIPETLARTTLSERGAGARVNVETDLLGKYVLAMLAARGLAPEAKSKITEEWLRERGY